VRDTPSIGIDELRQAVRVLLDHVEDQFGSEIDLAADYYWEVDLGMAYDPALDAESSTAVTAGQLADDVDSVRQMLREHSEDPDDALIVWHDLAHVVRCAPPHRRTGPAQPRLVTVSHRCRFSHRTTASSRNCSAPGNRRRRSECRSTMWSSDAG
jgi:hypothetical protein